MNRVSVALLFVLTVPLVAWPARAESVDLSAGTHSLGGSIYARADVDHSDGDTETTFEVVVSPSAGYFIADGLELSASLVGSATWSDGGYFDDYVSRALSASFGATYYVNTGSRLAPFVGLSVEGYLYKATAAAAGESTSSPGEDTTVDYQYRYVTFGAPIGVLVGLDRNVALTLATRFTATLYDSTYESAGQDTNDGVDFSVTAGYLGVRAFF